MKLFAIGLLCPFLIVACKANEDSSAADFAEIGQEIGDAMAGLDESGGASGSFAFNNFRESEKLFARYGESIHRPRWIATAEAASCALAGTFSGCVNDTITRSFNGCTLGNLTFDGTITLTWTDAAADNTCQMTTVGHHIERQPNWTMTGRRGATLTVTSLGSTNQVLTTTGAGSFSFTNQDGIRRQFTTSTSTLFDFTTKIDQAITVTGANRNGRFLNGGNVEVTNNLSGEVCDIVPANVTWTNTCNCATSGTWSGTCADAGSVSLTITGCGTASLTVGSATESITFDRCYDI